MTAATLPAGARIAAFGEHRPARVVPNAALAAALGADDRWITERTGIRSRRIAAPEESVVTMAAAAAGKALAAAGVDPGDVDLVVLATCSMPSQIPGGAAQVAHAVGAVHAGAFDLNAACAGFCYGLSIAADAVRAGTARTVLVVGSEKLSDWTDWGDRRSAILFADGAGAAVVTASSQGGDVGPVVWGSDGGLAPLIAVPPGGKLGLDGPAVFRWAITALGDIARCACSAAGIAPHRLALIVPHQANLRIVAAVARSLDAPRALVADDIVDTGNTSAASIPLALSRMAADGRAKPGDLALLLGFGAGLTWAGQVVRIP